MWIYFTSFTLYTPYNMHEYGSGTVVEYERDININMNYQRSPLEINIHSRTSTPHTRLSPLIFDTQRTSVSAPFVWCVCFFFCCLFLCFTFNPELYRENQFLCPKLYGCFLEWLPPTRAAEQQQQAKLIWSNFSGSFHMHRWRSSKMILVAAQHGDCDTFDKQAISNKVVVGLSLPFPNDLIDENFK